MTEKESRTYNLFLDSVADPGRLSRIQIFPSRIRIFPIPDPHQRITQKIVFKALGKMIRVVHPDPDPGSWFFCPSRIQGSNRHRISDPDPQHCFYKRKLTYFVKADSAHLGQYEGQLSHVTRLQGGTEPDQVAQCISLKIFTYLTTGYFLILSDAVDWIPKSVPRPWFFFFYKNAINFFLSSITDPGFKTE